jgi:hypothetical protein
VVEIPQIETQELNVIHQFERLQELSIFNAGAILINGKAEFGSLPSLLKLCERVYELLNHEARGTGNFN